MSSITITKSEHDLTFHIHETKPYTIPDVRRTITISLDRDGPWPADPNGGNPWSSFEHIEAFWVKERQQWIGFEFTSYRERSSGPNEEDYYGPYVVSGLEPPPDEDGPAEGQGIPHRTIPAWPGRKA